MKEKPRTHAELKNEKWLQLGKPNAVAVKDVSNVNTDSHLRGQIWGPKHLRLEAESTTNRRLKGFLFQACSDVCWPELHDWILLQALR